MKRWTTIRELRLHRLLGIVLGLIVFMINPVRAAALSQGYKSSEALTSGSLVGLDPTADNTVRLSNTDRVGELLGVVVDNGSSLLSVSSDNANVQVVTTGTATTLVSNVNGDIKKGDGITVSPINGVGMKATAPGRIVGLAQEDFSASTAGAVSQTVNAKSGKQQVAIGGISLVVSVGYYTPKSADSVLPQSVQNLASFLAGRQVSTFRIITASILLLLGIILVVIILNSAVRSSMESIGRNPLARSAVSSGLFKVLLLTLAILLVTFGSVYFVIRG